MLKKNRAKYFPRTSLFYIHFIFEMELISIYFRLDRLQYSPDTNLYSVCGVLYLY